MVLKDRCDCSLCNHTELSYSYYNKAGTSWSPEDLMHQNDQTGYSMTEAISVSLCLCES